MNRILRPIKRFLRGLTRRMRIALALALVLALSLGAFGIYCLVREDDETSSGKKLPLLFEQISRETAEKIYMYPKDAEPYSVERYVYEKDGTETAGFILYVDGVKQEQLNLEPSMLSALIVGTGTAYIYDTVLEVPAESDPEYALKKEVYDQKLLEYELTDEAPYYEIVSTSGQTHRVYFGRKSPTGSSYYMRLAGRDAVYIASGSTIGDLLHGMGSESLVNPAFFIKTPLVAGTIIPNQGCAWADLFRIKNFTRYKKEDPKNADMTVEAGDGVGVTLKNADGSFTAAEFDLSNETNPAVFAEQTLGKKLGNCDFTFEATFTLKDENGNETEQTRVYHVVSIDYIQRGETMIESSYVQVSERNISHFYSIYKFTLPSLKQFLPDTADIMTALQDTYALTGSVVKIGIDTDAIEKYGLYRHTVEIDYPVFDEDDMYVKDKNGENTQDIKALAYMPGYLYVSDTTERGTRYVGSLMYDLILEVDGATLDYLDYDLSEWVEPDMVGGAIADITGIYLNWQYGDASWMNGGYQLSVTHGTAQNYDGSSYEVIKSVLANKTLGDGKDQISIDPAIYTQFFYRLYYIQYKGTHGLSDDELQALLADKSRVALHMNVYYEDDTITAYRFIPISSDRVLVAVSGEGAESGAHFVIYGTSFKDLARAYISMMEGKAFEHQDRY